jgi:hypothetical protein
LKKKSETEDIMVELIKDLKERHKVKVKNIRLDNAGENKALKARCLKEGLGINFEFTAPGTPQQNGRVERKFATLISYARAALNDVNLEGSLWKKMWAEAASTVTTINNVLIKQKGVKSPYELFFGRKANIVKDMRRFGEMAIVTYRKGSTGQTKIENKGRKCIFLGYSDDFDNGAYRMMDIKTKKTIHSRDVRWLQRFWNQKCNWDQIKHDEDKVP